MEGTNPFSREIHNLAVFAQAGTTQMRSSQVKQQCGMSFQHTSPANPGFCPKAWTLSISLSSRKKRVILSLTPGYGNDSPAIRVLHAGEPVFE